MPYSDGFRAFLQAGGQPVVTLDITWNGGLPVGRYCTTAMAASHGAYKGLIQEIQDPVEGIDPKTASLAPLEATVTVIDTDPPGSPNDRALEKILEGATDQHRVAAILRWGHPDLVEADWDVRLSGILDHWTFNGGTVDLVIRTDDKFLRSGANRWPIMPSEWPALPEVEGVQSQDIYLPVLFGAHESSNLSARGFVPAIFVQQPSENFERWDFVTLGWPPMDPTTVYRIRDGQQTTMSAGGDYSISRTIIGGKAVTLIVWVSGADILDTDTVQFDGSGLSELGDGSGIFITNPVTQLRFWLVNFGHGRWLSGNFLSEADSPIELVSWAEVEAYAQKYNLEGSFRVGGTVNQRTILDQINEWLETWPLFRPYWTAAGKLALAVIDHTFPQYAEEKGSGDLFFSLIREKDVSSISFPEDAQDLIKRVSAAHLFDIAGNKNWGSMDVQDPSRDEDVTKTIRMIASVSKFG